MSKKIFPCTSCGGAQEFSPADQKLVCPFCDQGQDIAKLDAEENKKSTHQAFQMTVTGDGVVTSSVANSEEQQEAVESVKCSSCGATTQLAEDITTPHCPFCGSQLNASPKNERRIKPLAVMPFEIPKQEVDDAFRAWIKKRWFAPSGFKKQAGMDAGIKGIYIPHWLFNVNSMNSYSGRRGDHYYVTVSYTENDADGNSVSKNRQEQRTRWTNVQGKATDSIRDIIISATDSLPEKLRNSQGKWDLSKLLSHSDAYLSGFLVESYTVDEKEAFARALPRVESSIMSAVRSDIGGDEQNINHLSTNYADVNYRHVLLPLWISAYRFSDKVYNFLVNGITGEVKGERPWSVLKIVLFIASIIGGIAGLVFLYKWLS